MKQLLTLSVILLSLTAVIKSDDYNQHVFHDNKNNHNEPFVKSVAIIGGGASGSSTAFWLRNVFGSLKENKDIQIHTTIFERNDYIGGRSTTVPIKGNASLGHLEIGASIFVEANKNLMKATDVFGLKRTTLTSLDDLSEQGKERPGLGVWDGKEFLFEERESYWDTLKALWRYGFTPMKFQREQKDVVQRFLNIYNTSHAYDNVADIVKDFQFNTLINTTALQYLEKLGINGRFSQEILQSATRGNYCQDLDVLHGLALMVSMEASHGTWAVEQGNYRIFEEFAARSESTIRLNTKVTTVSNVTEFDKRGHSITRYLVETSDGTAEVFDDVVLAAPAKFSGIQFSFPTHEAHRNYHVVYVTLVAGFPDPSYFGKTMDDMPTFVVTTGGSLVDNFVDKKAPFNTFSVHRFLENGESVIKIFSPKELSEEFLDKLFLERSWTYRKGWHAFPELEPVANNQPFPSFVIKHDEDAGIIYAGAFENFVSTMETQTISGKNAARLLYEKWCKDNKNCPKFGDGWGNYL